MERADFILRLAVEEDRHPDLATVGDALIAWSNALRIAGSVIVPDSVPRIELIGVEPGSQMFRVTLKKTEDFAENLKAGAADYPLVTKTAITLATLIAGAFLGAFAQNVLSHDPQTSKEQMAVLIDLDRTMHESVELQKESANFFSILQNDPAIKGVSILSDSDRETLYYVPRSDFAHRSGLWGAPEAEVYAPRQRVSRWDVTLIRAAFVPQPRRWTFAKDGLEFSATMDDPRVLDAIRNRRLPIQIAEGVHLTVEVIYRERFVGRVWVTDPASRRIRRVLKPKLLPSATSMFPDTRTP